ncbi:MAG: AAA family ATPase [Dehalococcoidia bacterium]
MPEPTTAPRPLMVIVRGEPGAGKTTLARRLAEPDALGLPLLSRDAIKSGLVESHGVETDAVRTTVVPLAFDLLHTTIDLWLRAGVSLIAEEAFFRSRAAASLRALVRQADLRVIDCDTSDAEAVRRYIDREQANPRKRLDVLAARIEQIAAGTYPWRIFDAFDLGVPALRVDTSNGFMPDLDDIAAFCRAGRGANSIVDEAHVESMKYPCTDE